MRGHQHEQVGVTSLPRIDVCACASPLTYNILFSMHTFSFAYNNVPVQAFSTFSPRVDDFVSSLDSVRSLELLIFLGMSSVHELYQHSSLRSSLVKISRTHCCRNTILVTKRFCLNPGNPVYEVVAGNENKYEQNTIDSDFS